MKIILITNSYPYSSAVEDSFLDPEIKTFCELEAAREGKLRLIIAPLSINGQYIGKVPEQIEVANWLIEKNSFTKLISYLTSVFRYIKIHKRAILGLNQSLRQFKQFLLWDVTYQRTLSRLKTVLSRESDTVVLYTYWFTGATSACIDLKLYPSSRKRNVVITRAHGYDLYEERYLHPRRKYDLKNIDLCSSVSKAGEDYLKRYWTIANDRITHCYVGVESFGSGACSSENEISDEIRIVSCAFMTPVKRIPVIAQVMIALAERNPLRTIVWTHFGDGPEEHKVKRMIAKNAPSNLQWHSMGRTSNESVRRSFAESGFHVFISASESEGVPVSMMEACEAGIPIVAPAVGGIPEIVDHKNGVLVTPEAKIDDLVRGIEYCISGLSSWQSLSKNARSRWEDRFDARKNHMRFYESVIGLYGLHN